MDARTLGTRQILPYHLKKQRKKAEQENTHVSPVSQNRDGMEPRIFCARATRGRGLPSLDARTVENARPHF